MSEYKDLYLSLLKNVDENIKALNAYIEMHLHTKENQGKGKINLKEIYKKER